MHSHTNYHLSECRPKWGVIKNMWVEAAFLSPIIIYSLYYQQPLYLYIQKKENNNSNSNSNNSNSNNRLFPSTQSQCI